MCMSICSMYMGMHYVHEYMQYVHDNTVCTYMSIPYAHEYAAYTTLGTYLTYFRIQWNSAVPHAPKVDVRLRWAVFALPASFLPVRHLPSLIEGLDQLLRAWERSAMESFINDGVLTEAPT